MPDFQKQTPTQSPNTAGPLQAQALNSQPGGNQAAQDQLNKDPQQSINQKIYAAASSYEGTSTVKGPDGGNKACAWSVNNILQDAIGHKIGSNTNYVPSVEAGLQVAGQLVKRDEAEAGDIVVAGDQSHIGIYMGGGVVLSNSSSKKAFRWRSGIDFDGYYGSSKSRIYRVLK